MRDALFLNGRTFADFCASREHIPTNLLSDRLRKLVGLGLLAKVPYQTRPTRYEYVPTELGKALKPVLRALKSFGEEHLAQLDHPKFGLGDPRSRHPKQVSWVFCKRC